MFALRSQTIPVRANRKFDSPDGDTTCYLCRASEDTIAHQIQCSVITDGLNTVIQSVCQIEDIYCENEEIQARLTRIFEAAYNGRKEILSKMKII